jgi:hypothetical protein
MVYLWDLTINNRIFMGFNEDLINVDGDNWK